MDPGEEHSQSFEALCQHEQQLLDATLADVEFLSLRQSYHQAAHRFGEFRHHLEEHVGTEERVLLPLLIERTGDPERVVEKFRAEHQKLAQLVEAVASSISSWDRTGFIEQVAQLRAALKVHQEDEEARLYPHFSDLLRTAADWRRLVGAASRRR